MIKRIKDAVREMVGGDGEPKEDIIDLDLAGIDLSKLGLGAPPEPDMRKVGLFTDITEEKAGDIIHGLFYLNELNQCAPTPKGRQPIEFYISTYGGSADDMFAIYDVMKQIQKETEIHTIGLGKVMSAGVLLLSAGTQGKRQIAKNCRIMIHSVMAVSHGSLHNLLNEIEAIEQLQEMYINCMVENTTISKSQLKKMLERKVNIYLSAEEAVEYGIADIII